MDRRDNEARRLDRLRENPWQTDDTIGVRRWSYQEGMKYRSVDFLIDHFVDIVSKNGNLLLSVPPRPDGTLDEEALRILDEIGRWNRQNSNAVFGTRPWETFGEGSVRFTRSKDRSRLFAIFLEWPEGGQATVKALAIKDGAATVKVTGASLLGSRKRMKFLQDRAGLHLTLPERTNDYAVAVELVLDR